MRCLPSLCYFHALNFVLISAFGDTQPSPPCRFISNLCCVQSSVFMTTLDPKPLTAAFTSKQALNRVVCVLLGFYSSIAKGWNWKSIDLSRFGDGPLPVWRTCCDNELAENENSSNRSALHLCSELINYCNINRIRWYKPLLATESQWKILNVSESNAKILYFCVTVVRCYFDNRVCEMIRK